MRIINVFWSKCNEWDIKPESDKQIKCNKNAYSFVRLVKSEFNWENFKKCN